MDKIKKTSMSHKESDNKADSSSAGGELHQTAGGEHPVLTTNQGVPISDNQNSLKANPHGPTLGEDFILRDKITHFDHERI
ncbi:MAG TPA: catalase, partial [Clostridiaceae bacterium]|nr:catalase [Clostridiaceae bacterium]